MVHNWRSPDETFTSQFNTICRFGTYNDKYKNGYLSTNLRRVAESPNGKNWFERLINWLFFEDSRKDYEINRVAENVHSFFFRASKFLEKKSPEELKAFEAGVKKLMDRVKDNEKNQRLNVCLGQIGRQILDCEKIQQKVTTIFTPVA